MEVASERESRCQGTVWVTERKQVRGRSDVPLWTGFRVPWEDIQEEESRRQLGAWSGAGRELRPAWGLIF